MKHDIERRVFAMDQLKVEERGEGRALVIRGHAAVFNKLSDNLGGFREQIKPGAFDGVLQDDVRALFNHDPNFVLGRVQAKTLRLAVDKEGLMYEIDPPDTQAARDLMVSMKRGDIDQSSFAFTVDEDKWEEDKDGRIVRTIVKFKRLYDVSPVTYPAYPDASVGLRNMQEWRASTQPTQTEYEDEQRRLRVRLAEIS